MLKEFEYGAEAMSYVKEELSYGWTLALFLLKLPLESGRIISYLPETFSPANHGLRTLGVITKTQEAREHTSKIIELISAHLRTKGKRFAIFESLARVGDPLLAKRTLPYVSYSQGSEVYYFLTSLDLHPKVILNAIGMARPYPLVAVLTSLSDDQPEIQPSQELTRETLEQLAARTEHIIFQVYDGEGYLIWSKWSSQ